MNAAKSYGGLAASEQNKAWHLNGGGIAFVSFYFFHKSIGLRAVSALQRSPIYAHT